MGTFWGQTLNILQKSLNPGLFQVWIKPLEAECENGRVKLLAPNEFVASWVRDRLSDSVAEAAAQVMGARPKIEVGVKAKPKVSKDAPGNNGNGDGNGRSAGHKANGKTRSLALPGMGDSSSLITPVWRFKFEDFVVGPCNQMAFTAAQGLCRTSDMMDQLFLCSQPGLGKTHLLQAIGRNMAAHSNKSCVRVAYLTAEEFTNRLIMSIKSREVERFKAQFRQNVDVLLLEDVHFLQGKEKIQEELLSTLKALKVRGCKVAFTSSFLPRELKDVDSHLASRLCSGFLANIEKPDFETRKRIFESKAASFHMVLPDKISDFLADGLKSDVRQVESCLQNLILKARLLNKNIDLEMAQEVLKNYALPEDRSIGLNEIVSFICENFDLSQTQLTSKSRKRQIVLARNTAFYLARKHTDLSLKQIGDQFNRRHSTVIKGITTVEREISKQTPLGRQLDATMGRLT